MSAHQWRYVDSYLALMLDCRGQSGVMAFCRRQWRVQSDLNRNCLCTYAHSRSCADCSEARCPDAVTVPPDFVDMTCHAMLGQTFAAMGGNSHSMFAG